MSPSCFPWYSYHVSIMFPSCFHHVPIIVPSCFHHVPIIFPSCFHHVPIMFPSFSHHFPIMFPSCFHHVSIIFPSCFHHVSHFFKVEFNLSAWVRCSGRFFSAPGAEVTGGVAASVPPVPTPSNTSQVQVGQQVSLMISIIYIIIIYN